MIVVGLTGSIGMGKSTVTRMFAEEGAAVWNADDAVHRLYARGGAGAQAIAERFPDAIVDGAVDREILSTLVLDDAAALADLESIVHPLVAADRADFLAGAAAREADFVVLDIPLLFEKGYERYFDVVIVVSAPADIQKKRVLTRPGMTRRKYDAILAKQTPDVEKRRRADFIIDTGVAFEETRAQVREVAAALKNRAQDR